MRLLTKEPHKDNGVTEYGKLDLDYLTDWAETLNVESALKRLQDAAQLL